MAVSQLSIFAENKPGSLVKMTSLLAEAGVDIRAMSLADTQDYGILRLIVSDVKRAREILAENRFVTSVTPVLAVALPDSPGSLAKAISILCEAKLSIEYLYAFVAPKTYACAVLRVTDNERAEALLTANGYEMITQDEISKL